MLLSAAIKKQPKSSAPLLVKENAQMSPLNSHLEVIASNFLQKTQLT